jgi:hypothetical protein
MRRLSVLLVLLVLVGLTSNSWAQDCPSGNLLAGRQPMGWQDVQGDKGLITNGEITQEGAIWNASQAVVLDSAVASLTYDLGTEMPVAAVHIQADANDVYPVSGSLDGRDWKVLGQLEIAEGVHGLRSRSLNLGGVRARYLRIAEPTGDSSYSISEFQAFCRLPDVFPPALKEVKASTQKSNEAGWNDVSSRQWEMVLACLVLSLLWWGRILRQEGRPNHAKKLRDALLVAVLLVSSATYLNFFSFHFGNFIHGWDTFHYYVGSKYFKELGYSRLYECVAVADSEDPQWLRRVELRKLTNLRTNALETTKEILAHPEECKKHFTPARWQEFKRDNEYFRGRETPKRWDETSTDHGYNATPVWNMLGSILANTAPASHTHLMLLNMIDPLYYLGMILLSMWAFGWRVTAVAMAVFATNFPSRFYWTGGAFLRWDWLFFTAATVCFLKKKMPFAAGLSLGYAALLRVFPGFLVVGPVLGLGMHLYQVRKVFPLTALSKFYLRFFLGGILAVAVLVPASFGTSHGIESYKEFVKNSVKHKETPLTNYMGLRTVIAFRPDEVGRLMRDNTKPDPWASWKKARIDGYHHAFPVYVAIVLGFLVLIALATRKAEPWMAAAMGITFIPFAAELTCYYYAFIIGIAYLHEKNEDVGIVLLALTAASEFISLNPIRYMPSWIDEQYTWISLATLIAFGLIVWWFRTDVPAFVVPTPQLATGKDAKAAPGPLVPGSGDESVIAKGSEDLEKNPRAARPRSAGNRRRPTRPSRS